MSNKLRVIKRNTEKEELENLKRLYGKKPKQVCPKCHKKSLFMINKENKKFCVRCDSEL